MANIYVRSTDGSDVDTGATWALALATLTGAAAIDAAGDTIYVSQLHAESTASGVTIALAGTLAAPSKVIGVNDAAEPPTTLATGATITTTGTSGINVTGTSYLVQGLTFNSGTGSGLSTNITFGITDSSNVLVQDCTLRMVGTNGGNVIALGSSGSGLDGNIVLRNTTARFTAAGQCLRQGQCKFTWSGGGLESGGTSPTALVSASADRADTHLDSLDLSAAAAGINIFTALTVPGLMEIRNSKLPSAWSGTLGTVTSPAGRKEMYNCDAGDTNYRLWVEAYPGSIKSETTIVRTGGASDGTTPISWKIASNASAVYPVSVLESPEIVVWSDTIGAKTMTVEIVHDSQGAGAGAKFQDDEIWLEVMYLGTSGFPLGTWISDAKANVLATAANQTDSTETWTTTGLTTPVKQKLSVSFTTAEKGFIHARVVMAKASKTAYICPKLTEA